MNQWKIDWETQDYDENDKLIGITWRTPFTIRAKSLEEAKTVAMKRAHKEMQKLRRKHPEDFRCSKRHTPRILSLKEENGTYHKLSNSHTIFGGQIIEKDDYGSSGSSYAYSDQ